MPKKTSQGQQGRLAACSEAFGQRLRYLRIVCGNISQVDLAAQLGGFRTDTISRLERGDATGITLDLLTGMGQWAAQRGISAAWLFAGQGEPQQLQQDRSADATADKLYGALVRILQHPEGLPGTEATAGPLGRPPKVATAAGVDQRMHKAAEKMTADLRTQTDAALGRAIVGYVTVPPDQVPAKTDWWRHYVPIVGRIAAGEGLDAVEASEHPPGWCGEYLLHEGAPKGAVAVRVMGGSMMPTYRPGDMVVIDPSQQVTSGLCCVLLAADGEREPVLKKFSRRGKQAVLSSLARGYPPRRVPLQKIVATYKIIKHLPISTEARGGKGM